MNDQQQPLHDVLQRATEEINRNNAPPREYTKRGNGQTVDPQLGSVIAERFRAAAERTANAIEEQAQERMEIAQQQVEEAQKHIEQAKKIADDVRRGGEEEAKRAMDLARRLQESTELLNSVRSKFTD